jgi:hypothetical protein
MLLARYSHLATRGHPPAMFYGRKAASPKVGPTCLGKLVEHGNCLVGVISAIRVDTGKRFRHVIVTNVRILLQKETAAIRDVGSVND